MAFPLRRLLNKAGSSISSSKEKGALVQKSTGKGLRKKGSAFPIFLNFPHPTFSPPPHTVSASSSSSSRIPHREAVGRNRLWKVGGPGPMSISAPDFCCLRRQFLLRSVTGLHTRPCARLSIAPAYHPGMPPAAAASAAAAGLVGFTEEREPEPEQRPERPES